MHKRIKNNWKILWTKLAIVKSNQYWFNTIKNKSKEISKTLKPNWNKPKIRSKGVSATNSIMKAKRTNCHKISGEYQNN